MGYIVEYKYNQEITKGEYNREEVLSGSIKVGSPYEDIPLEVLAGKVMALMARRNILVFDVEVYEIAKKSLTFKELDDSIVIKNKKFRFDDGPPVSGIDTDSGDVGLNEALKMLQKLNDEQPQLLALLKKQQNNGVVNIAPTANLPAVVVPTALPSALAGKRPLRQEVFDPEPWIVESNHGNVKSMKFTKGKRYPIFQERLGDPLGVLYTTVDDDNRERTVLDKYFVGVTRLIEEGVAKHEGLTDTGLSWGGAINDGMPKLR